MDERDFLASDAGRALLERHQHEVATLREMVRVNKALQEIATKARDAALAELSAWKHGQQGKPACFNCGAPCEHAALAAENARERDAAREQIAQECCRVGGALAGFKRELSLGCDDGMGHVAKIINVLTFIAKERDQARAELADMTRQRDEEREMRQEETRQYSNEYISCAKKLYDALAERNQARAELARVTALMDHESKCALFWRKAMAERHVECDRIADGLKADLAARDRRIGELSTTIQQVDAALGRMQKVNAEAIDAGYPPSLSTSQRRVVDDCRMLIRGSASGVLPSEVGASVHTKACPRGIYGCGDGCATHKCMCLKDPK